MLSGTPAARLCRLPGIQTVPAEVAVVPPTMSDFSHKMVLSPSSAPTSAAVIPAAPAPITKRSVSRSQRRCSSCKDIAVFRADEYAARSQESDRYPGYEGHDQHPDHQRNHIADDRLQSFIRMHPADRAGRIIADAERRREQADAHGEDDHHRIMHFMDADLLGDREQQ